MPRPTTLPALLASLPRAASTSTHPVLVRPASWPATSYYKITRSTLKFRPAKEIATSSTRINPDKLVGGQTKEDAKFKEDGEGKEGEEGLEVGELKASGRVWGMLFWDGKYTAPQTKATNARPDPLIDGRTKSKWVVVDPSTLSQAARDLVQSTTPASVASSTSA